jgi:hypothetical protein
MEISGRNVQIKQTEFEFHRGYFNILQEAELQEEPKRDRETNENFNENGSGL